MTPSNDKDSPGFLAVQPKVKKTNKKILTLIMAAIIGMAVVLMVTMTSQKDESQKDTGFAAPLENENKPLTPPVDGFGLAIVENAKPIEEQKPDDGQIKIVGPPQVDQEEEARRREAEEIRRRKFERDQQAYGSALLVKREGAGGAAASGGSVDKDGDGNIDQPTYHPAGPDSYDPSADQDKEAFFVRSDTRDWISPYTREAGRRYEIKTGAVIPGIMVSGVNSDLPGNLIAQVSQNVYDTATGKHLLLPQGTKLYGVYDSRVVYGQQRVLIAWNRVVFPDGSSVTLGAMPGTDIAGYAGFKDKIDNHYFKIFGSAVLMSLVSGGMSYAVDQVSNTSSDSNTSSVQDEMTAALAAQLGQTTLQLLQKNLNIKPTLEIRPGYEFNVVVTKDVVFRGPYGR